MLSAIEPFKANGKAMSDALMRLERETTTVGALLGEAARRLAGDRDDIGMSLRTAIADIDSLAAEIGDADEWPAGCDDMLDGLLRSAYTMASERQTPRIVSRRSGVSRAAPSLGTGRRPYVDDEPIAAVA